ncbi:hypothetical protein BDW22DRAFT_575624 [Trametopsis cervina]|nr:hypothetical protein BDW22DRAFT_575624 [Trametopsis cervina]
MHQALLIDEVFQSVLEYCADWEQADYRRALCRLARTCRAWKDPSTERLWSRLDSHKPLLDLYNDTESAKVVDYYAARVQHFRLTTCLVEPEITTVVLPQLRSASIAGAGCIVPLNFLASPTLRELRVDFGDFMGTNIAHSRSSSIAVALVQFTPHLESLRIRGYMGSALRNILPSLTSLRSLVLYAGRSPSATTLASLTMLPYLQSLTIHAPHIEAGEFAAALAPAASFAGLRRLRIRGKRALVCAILSIIPRGTLRSLHLDDEEYEQEVATWLPMFDLLASKTADTLQELTIDQFKERNDVFFLALPPSRLGLEALQPLSGLRALRVLTLGLSFTPDLTDRDIDEMATWWPHLERLDFGTTTDQVNAFDAPKTTFAALQSFAARCPRLHALVFPLDTSAFDTPNSAPAETSVRQTTLRTLIVSPPPSDVGVAAFVRALLTMFPGLVEIEFTSGDKSLQVDLTKDLAALDG